MMNAINMPSLAERMNIGEDEIQSRKDLLGFTKEDEAELIVFRSAAREIAETVVNEFYAEQIQTLEIRKIIGDAETLERLKQSMKGYVAQLFCGDYDVKYVTSRIHIGRVHARIGVPPKLYLSSLYKLVRIINAQLMTSGILDHPPEALLKLVMFDMQVVFDTYIQGLLDGFEHERMSSELPGATLPGATMTKAE